MTLDYRICAREILSALGGRENVVSIYHCMTRLRLVIVDEHAVNLDKLEQVNGVKGSYIREGQLHVILGVGVVTNVYDEILMISNVTPLTEREIEQEIEDRQTPLMRAVKIIGEIFIPILPAMIASGMMTGILISLEEIFPSIVENDLYNMLYLIAHAAMNYLPVLVAFSAGKRFGGNPYLAGSLGLLLQSRELYNAWNLSGHNGPVPYWSILGQKVYQVSYDGHIIPIIVSVYFMCKLERYLHKKMPNIGDVFITPLLTFVTTSFLTLCFVGPFLKAVETTVMNIGMHIIEFPYGLGSAILAGLFPLSVVLGIQHMFMLLEVQLLTETGINIWIRIVSCANFAMCISCLAVALKTKSQRLKGIAVPAGISAALGVTEPAIFGVNFRYHTPMICGIVGAAAGGAVGAVLKVYGTAYGLSALPGLILSSPCLWQYSVMLLVTAVVTFSFTYVFWKDESHLSENELKEEETEVEEIPKEYQNIVYSPIQGEVISMKDIPDETFSNGYLGLGIGFIPDTNDVIAPFDGKVITITETKHAIGLEGPNGARILIHIGMDTVDLDGSDFTVYVSQDDNIKRGEHLISFNREALLAKGCNLTSAICIINSSEYPNLKIEEKQHVSFGDILFRIDN